MTARPGVLDGAIDAFVLAPLQLGLDTLSGRRSLKRTDFLVGDRLGEGSFGVVYSGVVVPKNVSVDDSSRISSGRRALQSDQRFKEKVILKKVVYDHLLLWNVGELMLVSCISSFTMFGYVFVCFLTL